MRLRFISSIVLLAAGTLLSACGNTIAFTYHSDEDAWQKAREAGKAAVARKDLATAETEYRQATDHARHVESTNPHHLADTLLALGEVLEQEGKTDDAKKAYQEALGIAEKHADNKDKGALYVRVMRQTQVKAWLRLGNMYAAQKDYKNAQDAYKQGLAVPSFRSGMLPTIAELKQAYAKMLDEEGADPKLAQKLRDEASAVTDRMFDDL